MGYGEAVRWSKDKKSFGKGNLEGVISSETANNAATGAAMIPLLALGLPGGALTAMMVAVFQMHDMEPGPLVFYNSPDLIWVVFAAMFYANVSILFIGLIETKTILYLAENSVSLPCPDDSASRQHWIIYRARACPGRDCDVWRGHFGLFAAAVRLFNSGDRSWHYPWQDRRTEFCPRHADGALRST